MVRIVRRGVFRCEVQLANRWEMYRGALWFCAEDRGEIVRENGGGRLIRLGGVRECPVTKWWDGAAGEITEHF